MKILVACEESQIVTKAFRDKGHEAYSCDILSTSGANPEWHFQHDVKPLLREQWDMVIAHPPCTYLCIPGAHYLHTRGGRWGLMLKAKELFMDFINLDVERICVENPLPHRYAELPKYTQIIQPWQFGHEVSKRTCLWLKGLPELVPTKIMDNHGERYRRKDGSTSNSKWYAKASQKERSRTFQGIADAMAEQWGSL